MKRRIIFFLLMLQLLSFAASCSGSASISVPAVVGDGSGLVSLSVRMIPGSGAVFLSAFPQTGTSTQESVEDAVHYAFKKSNASGCDAVVSINTSGSAGYVDGPSAGAAFTVMAYGALSGIEPRNDAVVTGTIERDGSVGQVGGIYEKALAAAGSGASYFVIPEMTIFDALMLRNLAKDFDLDVVEINTADEAIGFMLYNKTITSNETGREPEPIPDVETYDASGISAFGSVASRMIDAEATVVDGFPMDDNESVSIKRYFQSSIQRQRAISDKGYFFTAANEAFLDYIQASTINAILSEQPELQSKKTEISNCIQSVPKINKTSGNFEWVIGSDQRRAWAEVRLNQTDITKPKLLEEKYLVYNELMYSDAWCRVATILSQAANDSGTQLDESAWQQIAKVQLENAGEDGISDPDLKERLIASKLSYNLGKYGASVFDSTYILTMKDADSEMHGMPPDEISQEISAMLSEKRTSLWGSVYQAHGAFLASKNVSETESAFRILRLAKKLDELSSLLVLSSVPVTAPAEEQPFIPANSRNALIIMSTFLIITVLLLYIAARAAQKGRSYGTYPEGKRPRGIPGTGKNQG